MFIFAYFVIWNVTFHLRESRNAFNQYEYIQTISILSFLSYPVLICFDRANPECFLYVLVGLFIVAFQQKRYLTASVLLALATSMKLFPVVFIVLFLKEKRFHEAATCILLAISLTLFALLLFPGELPVMLKHFWHTWNDMTQLYIVGDRGLFYSASLFSLFKIGLKYYYLLIHNSEELYRQAVQNAVHTYAIFTMVSFGVIALYILTIEKTFWKQVMLLTACMILFPTISGDYKLIYLFVPLLLFFTTGEHNHRDRL
jgi:hypothetical protein